MTGAQFLKIHAAFEREYVRFYEWVKLTYPTPRFTYSNAYPNYSLSANANDIKPTVEIIRSVRFGGHDVIDTVEVPKTLLDAHFASIEALKKLHHG
jgi:hypothetical protein